ncbi:MAG: hypothetical protein Q9159_003929 [Coniocarpon cinnabarinum]
MSKIPSHKPRVIIHGGAGNITRQNLSPELWQKHQISLLSILDSTNACLQDGHDALTAAVHAVKLFESSHMYNCGRGAVFTRTGTIELEASVMVSTGRRKRGAAVSLIKHVKHPVELAAKILRTGDENDGGGAQGHVHISGTSAEALASQWSLDLCDENYFWTRRRWQEHCRDLDRSWTISSPGHQKDVGPDGRPWQHDENDEDNEPRWNMKDYLPQGTVGCVCMDQYGSLAVATSTGGVTNKLPGRIGDTPTFGAGFWAEEWLSPVRHYDMESTQSVPSLLTGLRNPLHFLQDCLNSSDEPGSPIEDHDVHSVAMSGTGNGDSFLRLSAVRTVAALVRFSSASPSFLGPALTWMAGPGGQLQRSAGNRWGSTGEGAGGIIGIERRGSHTSVVADFNCGGMFRAWLDRYGGRHCKVFHEDF